MSATPTQKLNLHFSPAALRLKEDKRNSFTQQSSPHFTCCQLGTVKSSFSYLHSIKEEDLGVIGYATWCPISSTPFRGVAKTQLGAEFQTLPCKNAEILINPPLPPSMVLGGPSGQTVMQCKNLPYFCCKYIKGT